jgi:hypothetical protein
MAPAAIPCIPVPGVRKGPSSLSDLSQLLLLSCCFWSHCIDPCRAPPSQGIFTVQPAICVWRWPGLPTCHLLVLFMSMMYCLRCRCTDTCFVPSCYDRASSQPNAPSVYGDGRGSPPARRQDWKAFVRALLARYRGLIYAIEVRSSWCAGGVLCCCWNC